LFAQRREDAEGGISKDIDEISGPALDVSIKLHRALRLTKQPD